MAARIADIEISPTGFICGVCSFAHSKDRSAVILVEGNALCKDHGNLYMGEIRKNPTGIMRRLVRGFLDRG